MGNLPPSAVPPRVPGGPARRAPRRSRSTPPETMEIAPSPAPENRRQRWFQLIVGVAAMVATANLQYGWTLFVEPIRARFGWSNPDLQFTYSAFILAQTWLVPVVAYFVDKSGPRVVLLLGSVLVTASWAIFSGATSLTVFYLGGLVGGIGAGMVYITSVGNALKWFSDRRGFAAGVTAAAYGGGAALTVTPIYNMIARSGYQHTFLVFALIQGAVILAAGLCIRVPPPEVPRAAGWPHAGAPVAGAAATPARNYSPGEVLRSPLFWLLYVMFVGMAAGGLITDAQMGPIAKGAGIDKSPVAFLGLFTMAALPLALQMKGVLNGVSRIFFGWTSDSVGRELTMFVAFAAQGLAVWLMVSFINRPGYFVLFSALVFFTWGEIFSLFPAISGDLFGKRFATTNYALLYTAKGTASLLVPLSGYLRQTTGSWWPIFSAVIVLNILAAVLAWFVLRPLARRWKARTAETPGLPPVVARPAPAV